MHQALQTTDILAQIFHFLRLLSHDPTMWAWRENDADFQVNPRHCLSAALTCKTFLEPALNMLWYACDNLERLVRLIEGIKTRPLDGESEDNWSNNKGPQNMFQYYLDAPLSPSSLTTFKAYNRRIRVLCLRSAIPGVRDPTHGVHPGIWVHIQASLDPGELLFPTVRNLRIGIYTDLTLSDCDAPGKPFYLPLRLLISPILRDIKIDTSNSDSPPLLPDVDSFLHSIITTHNHPLQRLQMSIPLPLPSLQALFILSSVKELGLYYRNFDVDFFEHLAAIPGLKMLSLCPYIKSKSDQPSAGLASVATRDFADLTNLALTTSPRVVRKIFKLYHFPRLVELQLFLHNEPEHRQSRQHPREDEWEAAFEALANSIPQLNKLHVAYELLTWDELGADDSDAEDDDPRSENENSSVHYWQDPSTLFLPWRAFAPLLGLADLQDFQCLDPKITGFDSEEFSNMAMAWRQLRYLRISNPPRRLNKSQSGGTDDRLLDHQALIAAAKYLCHLERLVLHEIDLSAAANGLFERNSLIEGPQSGHPLAILDFELITLRPLSSPARRSGSNHSSRVTSAEPDSDPELESANETALRNVAGFIDTLFPNLTCFYLHYRYSGSPE